MPIAGCGGEVSGVGAPPVRRPIQGERCKLPQSALGVSVAERFSSVLEASGDGLY